MQLRKSTWFPIRSLKATGCDVERSCVWENKKSTIHIYGLSNLFSRMQVAWAAQKHERGCRNVQRLKCQDNVKSFILESHCRIRRVWCMNEGNKRVDRDDLERGGMGKVNEVIPACHGTRGGGDFWNNSNTRGNSGQTTQIYTTSAITGLQQI